MHIYRIEIEIKWLYMTLNMTYTKCSRTLFVYPQVTFQTSVLGFWTLQVKPIKKYYRSHLKLLWSEACCETQINPTKGAGHKDVSGLNSFKHARFTDDFGTAYIHTTFRTALPYHIILQQGGYMDIYNLLAYTEDLLNINKCLYLCVYLTTMIFCRIN